MENYNKTIQTYNEVALNYENKFMEMDLYNDTCDFFCSLLNANSEVLDIGCGPGNISKYFLNIRKDLKITGIDLAPNMIERAKLNVPNANFIVKDALKIDELTHTFDGVVIGFCMPYLNREDSSKLIRLSSQKLNLNGIIYISTMEDDYGKSGYETTSFSDGREVYVYYHQEDHIKTELINNGFEILKIERKDYPEPDGTFLTDMIFIARKK
ncbi:2-polyprenyl-3-methyl-5-hydroxy-6-metoxy-1,4-benzoquinol methylase [Epilithonimonas hungarica]|uniref:class I SAM-dependent methyltransferase n=1 Tax=Epilithonimonas hungarica TaxID=454006 RepID=UPI002782CC3F|nr:class I SAM-dependent methyltransferase [Epilithonimonas hungarica]MDP9956193.1 2-polyprenyl-3-methyl-5-hydroxy-6-metoxy-1,4-benzoquinol methylase [Epilithonimonas hungarica]